MTIELTLQTPNRIALVDTHKDPTKEHVMLKTKTMPFPSLEQLLVVSMISPNCSMTSSASTASASSTSSTTSTPTSTTLHHQRKVSFGSVKVREFNRIAGDHPDCSVGGPPMGLDWKYVECPPVSVNHYEGQQRDRRHGLYAMSPETRKEILQFGFRVPAQEIADAERRAAKAARQREQTKRRHERTQKTRRLIRVAAAKLFLKKIK